MPDTDTASDFGKDLRLFIFIKVIFKSGYLYLKSIKNN